jgi:hypothetical protein
MSRTIFPISHWPALFVPEKVLTITERPSIPPAPPTDNPNSHCGFRPTREWRYKLDVRENARNKRGFEANHEKKRKEGPHEKKLATAAKALRIKHRFLNNPDRIALSLKIATLCNAKPTLHKTSRRDWGGRAVRSRYRGA